MGTRLSPRGVVWPGSHCWHREARSGSCCADSEGDGFGGGSDDGGQWQNRQVDCCSGKLLDSWGFPGRLQGFIMQSVDGIFSLNVSCLPSLVTGDRPWEDQSLLEGGLILEPGAAPVSFLWGFSAFSLLLLGWHHKSICWVAPLPQSCQSEAAARRRETGGYGGRWHQWFPSPGHG